jgi:hypothetical protein
MAAFRHVVDLSKFLGIDSAVPKFVLDFFERGEAARYEKRTFGDLRTHDYQRGVSQRATV